jgi:acyl carrier protein
MEKYSQQFFQLMQQQYALLTNERCTQAMLESFERSLAYFHEHQAQMQRVHEQYLKNQDYSQSVLQWMPHSPLATGDATLQQDATLPKLPKTMAEESEKSTLSVSPSPTVKESEPPITESAPPQVLVSTSIPEPVSSNDLMVEKSAPLMVEESARIPEPVSSEDSPSLSDDRTEFKNESVATSTIDLGPLTQSMLNIVSEKTGYPADMLEIEMDMEADLGIDSIKRVEILGAMQEQFPDLPPVNPDELTELRTLGEIVEYMGRAEKKK